MYHYVFFDLDGTLTNSKEGILKSIVYALNKMGEPIPDEATLTQFIGPPLQDSFMRYCGFNMEKAKYAITVFRERYGCIGMFENAPASGMPELCAELKRRGYVVALASSKPERLCVPICKRFGYAPSMTEIVGSPETGDWNKDEVIREVFRRLHLTDADRPQVLMVGDRKFDVEGATRCGIDCVGVEFFGYAAPGELKNAGATAVVQTVRELRHFILCA